MLPFSLLLILDGSTLILCLGVATPVLSFTPCLLDFRFMVSSKSTAYLRLPTSRALETTLYRPSLLTASWIIQLVSEGFRGLARFLVWDYGLRYLVEFTELKLGDGLPDSA